MHSDWFFLGRDFAIRTITMEMVISSDIFFCFRKPANSGFATKTTARKHVNALIFAKKLPKTLIFYRAYNKNEEDEYSRSEFYYPEDLETSNVKTESDIGEGREAMDDFIKKQKSSNTNMKMDLNTLLQ